MQHHAQSEGDILNTGMYKMINDSIMQLYNLCLLGMEKVALIYFLKLTFYFQVVFQLVCHLFLQSRFVDERHNVWTVERLRNHMNKIQQSY